MLPILDNTNVERDVTSIDAMAKIRELLESGLLIDGSDCSIKSAIVTQEAQRLAGLVESKNLELETMPGWLKKLAVYWKSFLSLTGTRNDSRLRKQSYLR